MSKASPAETASVIGLRRLLADYGRPHVAAYVLSSILMALGAAATAGSAWILKPVLNHMVSASGFSELRRLSFAVAGLFLLRGVATYGSLVLLARAGNKIVATVQSRVFDNIVRQDLRFFQDRHSSEFMTRLTLAANSVRTTLQLLITGLGRDMLTLIGLVVVMIAQDPLMALIALSVMPIGVVLLAKLVRKVRRFARRSFDGSTRILATMQETVQGAPIVKSFNLEEVMRGRMAAAIREVERMANRVAIGSAISSPLADTLGGFAIAAVIFYGSWRITIGHADPGSFFSFVAALLMAYEPAKRVARLNLDLQNGLVGARMIYEVLDQPPAELPEVKKPALLVPAGRITLEKVRFGYRSDETVLDGVDFVAEPNATTALVGPSGGGKSTIISLIQRFYEPESGRIGIDGQDICAVDLASLREKIAFVSQDVFLFRGSIGDNIALGRPGASQAEIVEAAHKAYAHDFIMSFADGYDTGVGEQGTQLSGGQRQRVAIARAILKNAKILLLDEPTAALDSDSERAVQKALEELRNGRTTVVVAHRLQTIINADRICVVEAGRVVEVGTHDELIARPGTYRGFFVAQFGEAAEVVRLPAAAAHP